MKIPSRTIYLAIVVIALSVAPRLASAGTITRPASNLGLVGYWSFDEGAGTVAHDFSGQGNNGSFAGTPTWTVGKRGKALHFDGASRVTVPNPSGMPVGSATRTITAWVRPTGSNALWGFLNYGSGDCTGKMFGIGYVGSVTFWGGCADYQTGVTWAQDQWVFLAVTYSDPNAIMYVNGTAYSAAVGTLATPAGTSFQIGMEALSRGYFTGDIDEVRVYNRALSAAEITALRQVGEAKLKAPDRNGLVGNWSFDEGAGTVAHDFSGNGRNGALVNSPTWTNGKLGKGLKFNGSNTKVTISDVGFPSGASARTISLWMKYDAMANTYNTLFGYGTASVGQANGLILHSSNKILWFGYGDDITSNATIQQGAWYHVVGTYDGATATIYINGAYDNSAAKSWNTVLSKAYVGEQINDFAEYFSGTIDDVRVYSRALSAAEVASLYQSKAQTIVSSDPGPGSLASGLVLYFPMSGKDISGTTLYDRSGNGTNGTLSNVSVAAGKVGQGLSFNGTNSHIPVTVNVPEAEYTFSSWFKTTASAGVIMAVVDPVDPGAGAHDRQFGVTSGQVCHRVWSEETYCTTGTFNDGKWHLATVTVGSGGGKLYVDGVQLATGAKTGSDFNWQTGIVIGWHSLWGDFNGMLDDVRVYNRVLSAAEVKRLYNLGR